MFLIDSIFYYISLSPSPSVSLSKWHGDDNLSGSVSLYIWEGRYTDKKARASWLGQECAGSKFYQKYQIFDFFGLRVAELKKKYSIIFDPDFMCQNIYAWFPSPPYRDILIKCFS